MKSLNADYHCSDETYFRRAEGSLSNAVKEGRITQNDRKLIEKYALRLKASISSGRYMKIVSMLVNVRRYFPVEYAKATEDDYLMALSNIKYAKHQDGKNEGEPYSQNTIADWMKITKRFFKFLNEEGLSSIPIKRIEETKTGGYDRHTKTDNDVLSPEEINAIIKAAATPKYKAYFGILYELGARSIEMANLKWKDIEVRKGYVICTLHDTKTNQIRVIPSVIYSEYLLEWRKQYPGDATGENFVFINLNKEPFKYAAVRKTLSDLTKKAGITKTVTLHNFRHSRITHVLREGMSETLVKKAYWGNVRTSMIDTYGHLTNKDIEKEYLRMAGVEIEPTKEDASPKPITCPDCLRVHPPGTRFCTCGKCLDASIDKDMKKQIENLDDWFAERTDVEKFNILQQLNKK